MGDSEFLDKGEDVVDAALNAFLMDVFQFTDNGIVASIKEN